VKRLQSEKNLAAVRTALANAEMADNFRNQGNLGEASKFLEAIKGPLWKTGDQVPAQKQSLQGLMAPIDELLTKWKNGDKSPSTSAIKDQLRIIIRELEKAA